MKALLMHPDRDFDVQGPMPEHESDLRQDLALDVLLDAMAAEDPFLFEVARKALLLSSGNDIDTVVYRQDIVRDALAHPDVLRQCYDLAVEAIEGKRKSHWGFAGHYPSSILYGAVCVLGIFMTVLEKLRELVVAHGASFESTGLKALCAMLQSEFDDAYLARVRTHLIELKLDKGVLLSAQLSQGNEGTNYALREAAYSQPYWLDRLWSKRESGYTFRIADRDQAGAQALSELRNRGINEVANALAQAMDHILGFFEMLRAELAFYVGCVNLHAKLTALGVTNCFPQVAGTRRLQFRGLCDASLALSMGRSVVGNALDADDKQLAIVTGANQGGKSSFLRSVGLAQLMMQSGMFVAAESFAGELCAGLFTHAKREEDATLRSGKFDEELRRLSAIVDRLRPGAVVLFNESFASTNELEGSEIARQVVGALLERGIKVFFVTHLYTFARGLFDHPPDGAIFLRAERLDDGRRTFRIIEGEPLQTSHGVDLYREVFGDDTVRTGDLMAAAQAGTG
ncbi:DNA mismatch repair protein MutS [Rhodanobacter sp. FW510-R12]|uniref:DNA mismatch repair protein MutS n=1 Tax=Rhodanobacter thiooxydans TaxID=416169 RepID=A0A154QEI0_9GAMM|nr:MULTISPECIES: DNA mismatch repair protein MutS [Rhodanobacter]KZC22668.1 DNA mismatch repair protein MutS [Rhodanobacter thiooxydans]UJJ49423.1 hypothetical protein LRK52_09145 [Rhodanobacter denitrificans]UJJ53506.1 hypothetical protein LRK53_10960 [Rhodanobacter thiooxydans]